MEQKHQPNSSSSVPELDYDDNFDSSSSESADRSPSELHLERQKRRRNVQTERQIKEHANAERRLWESRSKKNFPCFRVSPVGEVYLALRDPPLTYVRIVKEVVRRCDPDELENKIYSHVGYHTDPVSGLDGTKLELHNTWTESEGGFEVDHRVRVVSAALRGVEMPMEKRWEIATSCVDRTTMLGYRSEAYHLLCDHPFYKSAELDTRAKLLILFTDFFDRMYTDRILRLTIGHPVDTMVDPEGSFRQKLLMCLGFDATIPSPDVRPELEQIKNSPRATERFYLETNWKFFQKKLLQQPAIDDDPDYGWTVVKEENSSPAAEDSMKDENVSPKSEDYPVKDESVSPKSEEVLMNEEDEDAAPKSKYLQMKDEHASLNSEDAQMKDRNVSPTAKDLHDKLKKSPRRSKDEDEGPYKKVKSSKNGKRSRPRKSR